MHAKRRINSTNRKRIRREKIEIRMLPGTGDEPLAASAKVDLTDHNFPATAILSIEAYRRSNSMRFDCGTVGAPRIPEKMVLNQIDPNGSVLFRVKVADSVGERGRLLGSAERIQPLSDDENKDRRSLFPVQPWKLGEQLWKVDIESGSRPVLLVNRDIPEIKQWFRDKLLIRASVFPAAFRIVMEAIALGDAEDDSDDEDETAGWHEDWLKFCRDRLGVIDAIPAERPDREKWIDSAVERFCNQFNFVTTLKNAEAEEPR